MYERGLGVSKNYKEAVKWYRFAAEQGLTKAQYNLGLMYADGRGVSQDNQEAVKWYRLAADQGHARGRRGGGPRRGGAGGAGPSPPGAAGPGGPLAWAA